MRMCIVYMCGVCEHLCVCVYVCLFVVCTGVAHVYVALGVSCGYGTSESWDVVAGCFGGSSRGHISGLRLSNSAADINIAHAQPSGCVRGAQAALGGLLGLFLMHERSPGP